MNNDNARTATTVKELAIAHYERMIAAVEENKDGQILGDYPTQDRLHTLIGESWGGIDCPYCTEYLKTMSDDICCDFCPLQGEPDPDFEYDLCCDGRWVTLSSSRTWDEWVFNAKNVLAYIKEVG